jgi:hypothetical protein
MNMRKVLLALTLLLAAPAHAADETQVLLLGTFHFENPGLDYVKSEVPDVMSPERQKELAALAEALRRFKPTKVMVEWPVSLQSELHAQYAAYREGNRALTRNEVDQIGFRLAALEKLDTVYAIDVKGEMDISPVIELAQKNHPEVMAKFGTLMENDIQPQMKMQTEKPLRESLLFINDPARMQRGHEMYVMMTEVGDAANPVGAEQAAIWWTRNIRIFGHLARIEKPGDRIVVIFGSGHMPILDQLVRDMPGMKVVAARDFL